MDYRIYEHISSTPDHIDAPLEDLESYIKECGYTAGEAEEFIRKWVPDKDKFGNKRKVYVYRLK